MSASQPLKLEEFTLDITGNSKVILNVSCRNPGFMSWIVNRMGLDPNSSIEVTKGSISFRRTSGSGFENVSAPLNAIAAFVGGFNKPIGFFYASIFFLFVCLTTIPLQMIANFNQSTYSGPDNDFLLLLMVFTGILSIFWFLIFLFSKSMYMGFETSGGQKHILFFKGDIDITEIAQAVSTVTDLMGLDKPAIQQSSTIPMSKRTTAPPPTTFGITNPPF